MIVLIIDGRTDGCFMYLCALSHYGPERAQVQGGQTEKFEIPMSTTNKGHIKMSHKTMIYVLSLMSAHCQFFRPSIRLSIRPSIHPYTYDMNPSLPCSSSSPFPLIIFLIVVLLVVLFSLRSLCPYRFCQNVLPPPPYISLSFHPRTLMMIDSSFENSVLLLLTATVVIYCKISRVESAR